MRSKLFILLMFLPLSLFAQETVNLTEGIVKADSSFEAYPWTFEMMPLFNPWLASTNPAGPQFNPEILPGRLDLNY